MAANPQACYGSFTSPESLVTSHVMTFANAKQRFSNRVADYLRYRPKYPVEMLDVLRDNCGLRPEHVIADIGSGTGFLSELFLKNGNRVIGVEPNAEMRAGGAEYLREYPNFRSLEGSAESTGISEGSVDFITAGQAFHWFEPNGARREFLRILKPGGWVVVTWNDRRMDEAQLTREYEDLLERYGIEYARVKDAYPERKSLQEFFAAQNIGECDLPNFQELDHQGFRGRLLSSSYAPAPGDANFEPMLAGLEKIFRAHERNGIVRMEYFTRIYFGQLQSGGN
jgi:SAM-dependent methyltransferase